MDIKSFVSEIDNVWISEASRSFAALIDKQILKEYLRCDMGMSREEVIIHNALALEGVKDMQKIYWFENLGNWGVHTMRVVFKDGGIYTCPKSFDSLKELMSMKTEIAKAILEYRRDDMPKIKIIEKDVTNGLIY